MAWQYRMETQRSKLGVQPDEIELYKDKILGTGAFGQVYRAKYKCTPCAAKIIHPTLYFPPGARLPDHHSYARLPLSRFEQEIELLVKLRHPNIVQHLCVYNDPQTLGPVLLMELLECNLTDFLQKDMSKAITCEVQVSLCQDVSLALAYLHSEGIIHRDLSGNNILIGRGSVAKLSDFGMAKLLNKAGLSRLTLCPGTDAYMPPEAVVERPDYSEKIDCFSFGVVVIQILTRLYPEPGDRRREIHIDIPGVTVKGRVEETIEEVERRQNHISKVKEGHPLLTIALKCLADKPHDRPVAKDLCDEIEKLNISDDSSVESSLINKQSHQEQAVSSLYSTELEISSSKSELSAQSSARYAIERDYDIIGIEESLQFTTLGGKSEQCCIGRIKQEDAKSEATTKKEMDPCVQGKTNSVGLKFKWKSRENAMCGMCRHSDSVVDEDTVYVLPANTRKIFTYSMTTRRWSDLARCPYLGSSLAVINNHLTTIGGKRVETGYRYTVNTTAGYASSYSDILCTHIKKQDGTEEWIEKFPQMPTKRAFTTALKIESNLLVAGGVGGDILRTVEILNTSTSQWMSSPETDLPEPVWAASATLCNGNIYMLGGRDRNGDGLHTAYSCSLESFLLYCRPKSLTSRVSSVFTLNKPTFNVWNRITDVPVALSTCTSVRGHLLAVGGKDTSCGEPTTKIHTFNQSTNKWITINRLSTARSSCFVFSHPDNELVLYIVGGKASRGSLSNEMNIAQVFL